MSNSGHGMLFVSSGFLETGGLLFTRLINRGGYKDTGGNSSTPTEVAMVLRSSYYAVMPGDPTNGIRIGGWRVVWG